MATSGIQAGNVPSREAAVPRSIVHLGKSLAELHDRLGTLCVRLESGLQVPAPIPPVERGDSVKSKEPIRESCPLSDAIDEQNHIVGTMTEMVENWLRRIELSRRCPDAIARGLSTRTWL